MSGVDFRAISKSIGAIDIIENLDLEFALGKLCVLVGPSECGKSTLLHMIAGLEEVSSGNSGSSSWNASALRALRIFAATLEPCSA